MQAETTLTPAMTHNEQALLLAALEGRQTGIEFGCGGSTALILSTGLRRLLSADSDLAWLRRVAVDPHCAPALATGRLRLLHVDIGPTGAWGWPQGAQHCAQWPTYWRDPWETMGETIGDAASNVDFVFVDGRFRVACALNSLPRMAPGAVLLVHDFWSRAAYRGPLLRHFEVTGSAGSLAMLSPRQQINRDLLAADLVGYAADPR